MDDKKIKRKLLNQAKQYYENIQRKIVRTSKK